MFINIHHPNQYEAREEKACCSPKLLLILKESKTGILSPGGICSYGGKAMEVKWLSPCGWLLGHGELLPGLPAVSMGDLEAGPGRGRAKSHIRWFHTISSLCFWLHATPSLPFVSFITPCMCCLCINKSSCGHVFTTKSCSVCVVLRFYRLCLSPSIWQPAALGLSSSCSRNLSLKTSFFTSPSPFMLPTNEISVLSWIHWGKGLTDASSLFLLWIRM